MIPDEGLGHFPYNIDFVFSPYSYIPAVTEIEARKEHKHKTSRRIGINDVAVALYVRFCTRQPQIDMQPNRFVSTPRHTKTLSTSEIIGAFVFYNGGRLEILYHLYLQMRSPCSKVSSCRSPTSSLAPAPALTIPSRLQGPKR